MKGKYLITDSHSLTDKHKFSFAIVYNREVYIFINFHSSLDQKNIIQDEENAKSST